MLWVIRSTDPHTGQDKSIVVEAQTRAEAEYMGLRRGLLIAFVDEASTDDIRIARKSKLFWKYTPDSRHKVLGRPVGKFQVACLLACGVLTVMVILGNRIAPNPFSVESIKAMLHPVLGVA